MSTHRLLKLNPDQITLLYSLNGLQKDTERQTTLNNLLLTTLTFAYCTDNNGALVLSVVFIE
jgi:hypothetical protein